MSIPLFLMPKKESRQSINRQAAEVAQAVENINKGVTQGSDSPFKGGERTRKAFERNTKKRGVIQDYDGVMPLSASIQREMDADLREFATNLEFEYEIMVETLGEERAVTEIQTRLSTATKTRTKLIADIEKKAQFIATKSNLEFIKTAIGTVQFKKMEGDKVHRAKMASFVGNNGWKDVRQNSGDMFALITKSSDKSKRDLANKFIDGIEADEPVDLKKLIKEELGITGTRATFIARDQTAKFNSIVTTNRMNDFSISIYQWISTTGDGRTRSEHRKRNMKYFMIGTPTKSGRSDMPGEDYNCRCSAKPIVNEQQALAILTAIMRTPAASYTGVA